MATPTPTNGTHKPHAINDRVHALETDHAVTKSQLDGLTKSVAGLATDLHGLNTKVARGFDDIKEAVSGLKTEAQTRVATYGKVSFSQWAAFVGPCLAVVTLIAGLLMYVIRTEIEKERLTREAAIMLEQERRESGDSRIHDALTFDSDQDTEG